MTEKKASVYTVCDDCKGTGIKLPIAEPPKNIRDCFPTLCDKCNGAGKAWKVYSAGWRNRSSEY